MNDLHFIFEKFKPFDHERNNAAQDRLGHTDPIQFIETSGIHILHAIVDTRFYEECAVKLDYGVVNGAM